MGSTPLSKGPSPTTILHRRPIVDGLPPAPRGVQDPCAGPFSGSLDGDRGPVGTTLYLVVHGGRYGVIDQRGFTPLRLAEIAEARMSACGQGGWAFSAVIGQVQDGSTDVVISGSPPA